MENETNARVLNFGGHKYCYIVGDERTMLKAYQLMSRDRREGIIVKSQLVEGISALRKDGFRFDCEGEETGVAIRNLVGREGLDKIV